MPTHFQTTKAATEKKISMMKGKQTTEFRAVFPKKAFAH